MNEKERYEGVDMPFYHKVISPLLPGKILDFHAHSWKKDQWITKRENEDPGIKCIVSSEKDFGLCKEEQSSLLLKNPANPEQSLANPVQNPAISEQNSASLGTYKSARYMSTELEYSIEKLIEDGNRMFPLQHYHSVVFGQPTPAVDIDRTNRYIIGNSYKKNMFPLVVAGKGLTTEAVLRNQILEDNCFGYKVFLNWVGNDYGNICVEDMIGHNEMKLADELRLVVLLHVPRSGRLADPEVAQGVRKLSQSYPGASIVLAHCGRCYSPAEMKAALGAIVNLENVYLDTSMVMDPTVLHILFSSISARRILYATDFPVAAMRGRRVNVMDHWVDVVLEGYPESEFRVASNGIRATFMAYEIILAIKTAADTAGISDEALKGVFFDNGMSLLAKVSGEKQSEKIKLQLQ